MLLKKIILNISLIKFIKLFLEIQIVLINFLLFILLSFNSFKNNKINNKNIKNKIFNEDFNLLGPSLNVYYPIKSSIYSVSIRITGILTAIIFDI